MDEPPATKPTPKLEGIPLGRALAIMGGIALVAIALLGIVIWQNHNSDAKVKKQVRQAEEDRQRAELAKKEAAQKAQLALARNRQEDVLTEARNATNVLGRLLAGVNQLTADAGSLKTNEAGRLVALHPDLVAQAKLFYETEFGRISKPAEIITKLENARRVEAQVAANLGTAYEPEPALALDAKTAVTWADQEQQKLTALQNQMAALVSESKIKVTSATLTAESPTLESAILKLANSQISGEQQTMVDATTKARQEAAIRQAEIEAQRIKQNMLDQSNSMFQAMQDKINQQRRLDEINQASNQVADAKAKEAAQKVLLLQKAAQPEVKTKLAPFVTPGYWSPRGTYVEKKPLSYTILLNEGALDPSPPGLGKLAGIAMAVDDKVRPRWHLLGGRLGWFKVPSSLEQVKEAQKMLIELGPVLVETKDLEP